MLNPKLVVSSVFKGLAGYQGTIRRSNFNGIKQRFDIVLYLIVVVILLLLATVMTIRSVLATEPEHLGVTSGRFAPCPSSPNCVSTQCQDGMHGVEPIPFSGSPESAVEAIKVTLRTMPRVAIVKEGENYLHAVARSLVFRFPDDLEFFVDIETNLIHFRAASRVGRSDLGVNRARMTIFRKKFEEASGISGR